MIAIKTFFKRIKDASLEEIRFFVLCLFVFTLPFDRFYSQLLIIVLLVLLIIDFDIKKIKSIPRKFWIFQSFFLLTAFGLLITPATGMKDGLFLIEKQLAILLMPLIIPMSFKITENRVKTTLKTLTASSILSVFYLFVANIYNYQTLHIPIQEYISSGLLFNHAFAAPLNIHAGYLSMFLTLSFLFVFQQINPEKQRGNKYLVLQLCILLIGIILLSSRSNIFVIILVVLFVLPFYTKKNIKKKLTLSIISLSIIAGSFYFSPYLKSRFGNQLVSEVSSSGNQVEPRIVRWKEAINAIEESPIIGHGTGSESIKLKERYWQSGLINSFYLNYNSHNQFISITLKHGVIGLILFLCALGYYFRIAFQGKSFIYLAFLIQITFVFMIENVLDVNKGIFYFAFFNTLFGYFYLKKLNKNEDTSHIGDNSIV